MNLMLSCHYLRGLKCVTVRVAGQESRRNADIFTCRSQFASVSGITPERIPSVHNTKQSIPMTKLSSKKTAAKASVSIAPKLAYTRAEAAAQLGVHPITISRLTERGVLRPSRATSRPLYSHEELQRFLRDTASEPVKA